MSTMNATVWGFSVLLHGGLLVAVFRRGIARRVPLFAGLIAFYLLRSVALMLLAGRVATDVYALVQGGLAAVDTVLQLGVAWVLLAEAAGSPVRGEAGSGMTMWRQVGAFAGLVAGAAVVTAAGAAAIRANPRYPLDRAVFLTGTIFVLLLAMVLRREMPVVVRRLLEGFAVIGAASVVCQAGLTVAGAARHAAAFRGWSYGEPVVYLAVVVFWIVALPRVRPERDRAVEAEVGVGTG